MKCVKICGMFGTQDMKYTPDAASKKMCAMPELLLGKCNSIQPVNVILRFEYFTYHLSEREVLIHTSQIAVLFET